MIFQIFEKSKFASEIGAALVISPNGARVLSRLGFSFSKARAVELNGWTVVRGDTQELIASVDFASAKERFGAAIWAIHRVDLHNELLRLAISETEPGHPIRLHLSSEVVEASIDASIVLRDGSNHKADLVVAADGLHSAVKDFVVKDAIQPTATELSAFRFLIDTCKLRESDSISAILDRKGPEATLLADTTETTKERHIIWYPCREYVTAFLLPSKCYKLTC